VKITEKMIEAGLRALEISSITEFKGDPFHRTAIIGIFQAMLDASEPEQE